MAPPASYELKLHSVYHVGLRADFVGYLEAMQRLEEVVQGINVREQLTESNLRNMAALIAEQEADPQDLEDSEDAHSAADTLVPRYVADSFSKWTASKERVVIDLGRLKTSYPVMGELLLERESVPNLVAMERVNAVFKELQSIECRKIGTVDPPTYIPLLISVLEGLNAMEHSKIDTIHLNDIDNVYAFVANFEKLQSAICKQSWKIEHAVSSLTISRCRSCCDQK